jgi:phage terminase large subunit
VEINLRDTINPSFLVDLFKNRARLIACFGGAAAGKSKACAQKQVLRTLLYHNERILVIRKTLPSLKLTCLRMIRETLDKWHIPYEFNQSMMTIFVRDSEIIFLSVVNTAGGIAAERLKSLTDITAIWVEEATELSEDEMQQVVLRLRGQPLTGGSYRQLVATFNPVDAGHWLHKWVEVDHTMTAVRKTYHDNIFLDPEYAITLEALAQQDPNTYRVYCLGEWGALENIIYKNYAVELFDHPQDWYDATGLGLDFGWENPSAGIFLGVKEKDLYLIDEIYQPHLTNAELIELVKLHRDGLGWEMLPTVGDSAEPARLEEFEQNGFEVYGAEKAVADGITYVQGFRLHIHERCVNAIREVQAYKHRQDRNGIVLEDPVKWMDHTLDALRYWVYTFVRKLLGSGGGNV